jgi:hypothetical protein
VALLTDPSRRRTLGRRGAESARARFGMQVMLDRLQSLYDEVLDGGITPGSAPQPLHRQQTGVPEW